MFSKTQIAAIDKFKAAENRIQTLYLSDIFVKKVCASWEYISRDITTITTKAPSGDNQAWAWLWQAVRINIVELAYVTGSKDRCLGALAIARANHLIYPDGTVNKFVLQRLQPWVAPKKEPAKITTTKKAQSKKGKKKKAKNKIKPVKI